MEELQDLECERDPDQKAVAPAGQQAGGTAGGRTCFTYGCLSFQLCQHSLSSHSLGCGRRAFARSTCLLVVFVAAAHAGFVYGVPQKVAVDVACAAGTFACGSS
jgi:hypothetical protein